MANGQYCGLPEVYRRKKFWFGPLGDTVGSASARRDRDPVSNPEPGENFSFKLVNF